MFCSFTTLNDSPESPNSNLLDRFSLLGMCWKPFCTHLTLGHFWLNFVWDFQSLSQRKSPKKLKVFFAANGANQIMSGCFQKHPQYGVCNKYIPFFWANYLAVFLVSSLTSKTPTIFPGSEMDCGCAWQPVPPPPGSAKGSHEKNRWMQPQDTGTTLPETNSSHLKMEGWNTTVVSFWGPACFSRRAVSFRERISWLVNVLPPEIRP